MKYRVDNEVIAKFSEIWEKYCNNDKKTFYFNNEKYTFYTITSPLYAQNHFSPNLLLFKASAGHYPNEKDLRVTVKKFKDLYNNFNFSKE